MLYTQIYYHIVFSTKNRRPVLRAEYREAFFRYAWGVIKNHKCHLYRINAVDDHVHLFTHLHPTISLADFIKEIKVATNRWITDNGIFPGFSHWQEEYGAFTHSDREKDQVIEYVKNQESHHRTTTFREELRALFIEHGIKFDERFLE